jgi:4-hydroxybenzoate polyprenyltransferase
MALAREAELVGVPTRRAPLRALLVSLRPRQWSKNLFLFAGILFAGKLGDPARWLEAVTAFAAYCAASSGAYLVNDVRDAPHDRLHPVKRERPIARDELSARAALAIAAALAAGAVALVLSLGVPSLLFLLGFLILQLAYSFGLKRLMLVDVAAIAGLFVIRAAAGAEAVRVPISPWLLLCTLLLALFLGLAKRRGELVLVSENETPGRPVLAQYSLRLVDRLIAAVAAAALVTYLLYTVIGRDSKLMIVTVPFAVFGVVRYLLLIHRHGIGEEPDDVLLTDAPIVAAVLLWVVAAAVILTLV